MGTVGTHAINASLYAKMPYDHVKDFVPIVLVAGVPNVLVVHPSVPVNSVQELIAYAKANPGKLNFASSGSRHVDPPVGRALQGDDRRADARTCPYKGSAPALTDLLGGQVQIMFDNLPPSLPHIKAGKLQGARGDDAAARAGAARRADDRRGGRAGLRGVDRGSACSRRRARRATIVAEGQRRGRAAGSRRRMRRRSSRRTARTPRAARRRTSCSTSRPRPRSGRRS